MFNLWKYVLTAPNPGSEIGEWFEVVKETHYPFFIHNERLFAVGHTRETYLQIGSISTGMFLALQNLEKK